MPKKVPIPDTERVLERLRELAAERRRLKALLRVIRAYPERPTNPRSRPEGGAR